MKNFLLVLIVVLTQSSYAITGSKTCFQGWISDKENTYPTGQCWENDGFGRAGESLSTAIEIDFPTQELYIHGSLNDYETETTTWFKFTANAVSCEDAADGWTVVKGEKPTGEKYELQHRSIPGQSKGEAKLSVDLNGKTYTADLICTR